MHYFIHWLNNEHFSIFLFISIIMCLGAVSLLIIQTRKSLGFSCNLFPFLYVLFSFIFLCSFSLLICPGFLVEKINTPPPPAIGLAILIMYPIWSKFSKEFVCIAHNLSPLPQLCNLISSPPFYWSNGFEDYQWYHIYLSIRVSCLRHLAISWKPFHVPGAL